MLVYGPRLKKLLEDPALAIEVRDTIIAVASDGETVLIGNTFSQVELDRIERYLADYPTPDTW